MLDIRDDGDLGDFKYYYYTPTMAGAVIFILLFLVTTVLHFYQMFRTRTWFLIPFCIGGLFETVGYIGRALSHNEAPDFTMGPYIIQSLLLLVAPALFAASIYMELARIVKMVDGEHALFIRRRWLTRIFVTGDVVSFLMQSGGGGLLAAGGSSISTGENLIMAGLAFQLVFFFLFVVAGAVFHARVRGNPTEKCKRYPYEKHLWNLYIVSVLIFIRCLVRLIEYGQGWQGYIITHEAFLYIFDALLMWLAMVALFFPHPSEVAALIRGHGKFAVNVVFTRDINLEYQPATQMRPWA